MDYPSPTTDLPAETEAAEDPALANRWAGRRLADAINETFQLALSRGDTRTAEELLAVMERLCERERARLRYDNRHADPLLDLARRELRTRRAARRGY